MTSVVEINDATRDKPWQDDKEQQALHVGIIIQMLVI